VSDYEYRRLKRIFAQGWTAAERLTREQRRIVEADGSAPLNPHADEPERTRWSEGFDAARANGGRPLPRPRTFGRRGA